MTDSIILSIVIPTLNEEDNLRRLLPQLQSLNPCPEIIISDGGSQDRTIEVVKESGAKLITGAKGRGPQLNYGAQLCSGTTMLFLHADSTLPNFSYEMLLQTLHARPAIDGGAFTFSLSGTRGAWPRIYEKLVWLRSHILKLPYGDQGFFIRTNIWQQSTQFKNWPLMEDVEWWERMHRHYNLSILPWPLITSPRRFKKRGYLYSSLRNLATLLRYKLGTSPHKLAREYDR